LSICALSAYAPSTTTRSPLGEAFEHDGLVADHVPVRTATGASVPSAAWRNTTVSPSSCTSAPVGTASPAGSGVAPLLAGVEIHLDVVAAVQAVAFVVNLDPHQRIARAFRGAVRALQHGAGHPRVAEHDLRGLPTAMRLALSGGNVASTHTTDSSTSRNSVRPARCARRRRTRPR
jgi:hypothetical protein